MYGYEIKPNLIKKLKKLLKKDKLIHEQILRKIDEILNCYDITHYKNLKYNMKSYKRAHIGPFVLVFSFNKNKRLISFEDFDHHDNIYKRK